MSITTASEARSYGVSDSEFGPKLERARRWVEERVELEPLVQPTAVVSAIGLLAAVFSADPAAEHDESRVPNMVRLMLIPWAV